jgi:hypothetical protein
MRLTTPRSSRQADRPAIDHLSFGYRALGRPPPQRAIAQRFSALTHLCHRRPDFCCDAQPPDLVDCALVGGPAKTMALCNWDAAKATWEISRLIAPGVLGFYTHVEATEIFAQQGQDAPFNVFSILVAEERLSDASEKPNYLTPKRIKVKSLPGWNFGIKRYVTPIADLVPLLDGLCVVMLSLLSSSVVMTRCARRACDVRITRPEADIWAGLQHVRFVPKPPGKL